MDENMKGDIKKILIVVSSRFGMNKILGFDLNTVEEEIVDKINLKLLAATSYEFGKKTSETSTKDEDKDDGESNRLTNADECSIEDSYEEDHVHFFSREKRKRMEVTDHQSTTAQTVSKYDIDESEKRSDGGENSTVSAEGHDDDMTSVCTSHSIEFLDKHSDDEESDLFTKGKCNTNVRLNIWQSSKVLTDDNESEAETKMSEEREKLRKYIENCSFLLNICPYCKHRSFAGFTLCVRNHMKVCSKRRNKILSPMRI